MVAVGQMEAIACISFMSVSWYRRYQDGRRGFWLDNWNSIVTLLLHTKWFFFFFKLKLSWSAAKLYSQRHHIILGPKSGGETALSKIEWCLPGLLYSRDFLVVLRHWNINEEFNQLLWGSSDTFLFHFSVNICREIFPFLKNRESLLVCFMLSSPLLTFFKREVAAFLTPDKRVLL